MPRDATPSATPTPGEHSDIALRPDHAPLLHSQGFRSRSSLLVPCLAIIIAH